MTGLTTKTPWHLWVIGVVSLLWNGFGGFDFAMSLTRGAAYYREMGMSEAEIAQFLAMPPWMYLFWFIGVWGAVIGSILLLLRRRWAVEAFAASLVGAVVSLLYGLFLSGAPADKAVMPVVIVIIAGLLVWYAHAMRKRGVLR